MTKLELEAKVKRNKRKIAEQIQTIIDDGQIGIAHMTVIEFLTYLTKSEG